jgi:hypothetical protein
VPRRRHPTIGNQERLPGNEQAFFFGDFAVKSLFKNTCRKELLIIAF